ncbi:hypothetical protein B2G51_08015 [Leptospira santarosai]|nr:hypothetical protein B2G51_08015 [Leptospira santarosai]OLY60610.1 hypothetical protein BV917_09130 [Leptospira santarosai serovar Guaricura]ONF86427.1 hypothetical protein BWD13_09395 [Leptospira santarosai serovar Grippotyphosa]
MLKAENKRLKRKLTEVRKVIVITIHHPFNFSSFNNSKVCLSITGCPKFCFKTEIGFKMNGTLFCRDE